MIRHLGFIQYVALAVCFLAMQGCAADDPGSGSDSYFGSGIGVSARIADHVYTPGYQETGRVESGEYYQS